MLNLQIKDNSDAVVGLKYGTVLGTFCTFSNNLSRYFSYCLYFHGILKNDHFLKKKANLFKKGIVNSSHDIILLSTMTWINMYQISIKWTSHVKIKYLAINSQSFRKLIQKDSQCLMDFLNRYWTTMCLPLRWECIEKVTNLCTIAAFCTLKIKDLKALH